LPYLNYLGQPMPETAPEQAHIDGTPAGNETIQAPAGNSSIAGDGGGDLLIGSSGDNTFYIDDPHDRVQEQPNGGIDTEVGWTSIALAPNVENLVVHQDFNYAIGNNLDNLIIVDGRQWVYGGGGNDVLVGATNTTTTFVVKAGDGNDVIYNWQGADQLQLLGYGLNTPAQIRGVMQQAGDDTVFHFGNGDTLTVRNTTPASFADRQFLVPLDTSKLGAMTFDDEFNSLNMANPATRSGVWQATYGGNLKDQQAYTLTANGELQAYVAPGFQGQGDHDLGVNPFSVSNGVLTITAQPTAAQNLHATYGLAYTSGMLNTFDTFEQKYGYFEIRAALPPSAGAWPAFWLLPHPFVPNVEGDIFEGLGKTPNVDFRRAYGGSDTIYDNALKLDPSGFHTYGMLWTPTTVSFYYDGVEVLSGATPANWTMPMAMVLNLAVGGFGGPADASQFPAQYQIDYIHVYGLADGSSVVQQGAPAAPVDTLRDDGATSGQPNLVQSFADGSGPVTSATIQALASHPGAVPTGRLFVTWEDSGAVFGAVSTNGVLGPQVGLGAFSTNPFDGSGTWLTDGKVAAGYFAPAGNGSGTQDAWVVVFDPVHQTFLRQDLGPATGGLHFVATQAGGFAVSWHAPDGSVMARGYDEFAYGGDTPGWFGPVSQVSGDFTGLTADGHIIAQTGAGQELYDLMNASVAGGAPPTAGGGGGGGSGGQTLQATAGSPTVMGGSANDTISAGPTADYLRGGPGDDVITGGPAFDDINGNQGADTIHGVGGGDWLVGGQGSDMIFGGGAGDILLGNLGNDTLIGAGGGAVLRGGQGDDSIAGGAGNDYISGDRGDDTVSGGAGADLFHSFSGAGTMRVLDFNPGEGDRVMLDPGNTYSAAQVGSDTVITIAGGGQVTLVGVQLSTLQSGWIFNGP
jgi:beta-glucanase (GH16 family)